MQLVVQYSSELLMAIGLIIGSILLARFTWNRVKNLPPEEKSLGRPLWVATISIFLLGLASALNFGFESGITELEIPLLIVASLGSGLLMFSAIMIMGSKKLLAIPAVLVIGVVVYISLGNMYGGLLGGITSENLSSIIGLILFSIPFVLFTYLTITTKRITSFALAVVSITYPLLAFVTTSTAPELIAIVLALRLYGPALLITALILPETKIGGEVVAYGLTISSLFYVMSYLLVSPIVGDIALMISVSFLTLASILSIGTAAYTITRWRQSRNPATLTIGMYFFIGGFSFLVVALNNLGFIGGLNTEYFALMLGIIAPMILNLSSIVALDWKRALLLPVLIFAAPFVVVLLGWIAQPMIHPDLLPYRNIVMAISGILQSVIPLGLYGLLWRRMSKAEAPGRSRALFLALGIVLLIFGTAGGDAVSPISSSFILSAFVVWWMGITGRADRLLKTVS
ncbi:MAG: hypothetical protein RTV41_06385 [Candidatus Thorarchaeota archaeon]